MSAKARLLFNRTWGDVWIRNGWRVQDHPEKPDFRVLGPDRKDHHVGSKPDCLKIAKVSAPEWSGSHCVLLLHALAGHPDWMVKLRQELEPARQVVSFAYPTNFENLDASDKRLQGVLAGMAEDGIKTVALIGHSYGGLLIRAVLRHKLPVKVVCAATLGTPHQGSQLAEILVKHSAYNFFYGPAGLDVLPGRVRELPAPPVPTLSIAGTLGHRRGFMPLLQERNDGVVTVTETQLPNSDAQMVTVSAMHRLLPRNRQALNAVTRFLGDTP